MLAQGPARPDQTTQSQNFLSVSFILLVTFCVSDRVCQETTTGISISKLIHLAAVVNSLVEE